MTTLMVQTDRLLDNLNLIKKKTGGVDIIPVLSGNAFGLGDTTIAKIMFNHEGIKLCAVSRIEEAVRIKKAVPEIAVLLLTPYACEDAVIDILNYDIIATLGSDDSAVLLSGIAGKMKKTAHVHVKFDTGGGHCGFLPEDASKVAQTIKYMENINVLGVYSQLSETKNEKKARAQYELLRRAVNIVEREGFEVPLIHFASTSCAMKFVWSRMDAIRVGEGLTGRVSYSDSANFKKVGRLISQVCDIRWVSENKVVGLKSQVKLKKATKIALVPVGYADGLLVGEKNRMSLFGHKKSYCDIGGKRATIIGKPDYDTTMIDVTNIECSAGDMVSFDISPFYVNPDIHREYV